MSTKKKNNKKNNKVKTIVIISVVVMVLAVIAIFGYIVYKNIFAGIESKRYEGLEQHVLSKEEIDAVKEAFSKVDKLEKIDVYTESNKGEKSKIIKIYITLSDDVKFSTMKDTCNASLEKISEENLAFYDVEVFIESKKEDSSEYPQIGYKHRTNEKFSW